jgi:diadenosine tetraphosphatase ApaH/serine/threonine PP2A family protein phosphatase
MRIGILGDVHSNLEALTAAVACLRTERIDHWVQVGDIVGYGADPIACIELVRSLGCTVCLGNHDAAVVGYMPTDYFNQYARAAIEWTRATLRPEDLDYIRGLPLKVEHSEYTVVHGSLHLPAQFGYVFSPVEAAESLAEQRTKVAFVGHSHVPACYLQRRGGTVHDLDVVFESEFETSVEGYARVLLNVGSVGQPRDEDARAAYAIYDTATGSLRIARVDYDIPGAQRKIREAGLPSVLADRLALGV